MSTSWSSSEDMGLLVAYAQEKTVLPGYTMAYEDGDLGAR